MLGGKGRKGKFGKFYSVEKSFSFCNIHKSQNRKVFGKNNIFHLLTTELGTLEWWISGLMLNPLFLLISRD